MKELNQRMAYYRSIAGLTQADAAEKIGIKTSTFSQMERDGNVYVERFFELSELYNVPPCEMYYGKQAKCDEEKTSDILVNPPVEEPIIINQKPITPDIDELILTNQYRNHIKMLMNLPKAERNEVFDLAHKFYQKKQNN